MAIHLKVPYQVQHLKAGDEVLHGTIYTEDAHKRMMEMIERGEPLLTSGQIIYYNRVLLLERS